MSIDTQPIQLEPRALGSRCCAPEAPLSAPESDALAAQLELLAHPVRLQILGLLARQAGQICVCDLEAALPVKQATVSHHLRLLRAGGLVDCERRGQWAYYFVNRAALTAVMEQTAALLTPGGTP